MLKWVDSLLASCCKQSEVRLGSLDVPQDITLGPLLFSSYINAISTDTVSEIRRVGYHEIKEIEDTVKLQNDIDRLGCWVRKSSMRFQPFKCNIMQLTKKTGQKDQRW